jgi:transcriptional regulator of acetoin/glycerol metabolism
MEKEEFRDDLYYRVTGLRVTLPALRERKDLDAMIDHLLALATFPDAPSILTPEARGLLRSHAWKGNVRELQQALSLGRALSNQGVIEVDHLPDDIKACQPSVQGPAAKMGVLAGAEREAVIGALKKHEGNVSSAARELGITRATLYRKLKKFDLRLGDVSCIG